MKVKVIRYERLASMGQFENQRAAVELELDEHDDPHAAMQFAIQFVNHHLGCIPAQQQNPHY